MIDSFRETDHLLMVIFRVDTQDDLAARTIDNDLLFRDRGWGGWLLEGEH